MPMVTRSVCVRPGRTYRQPQPPVENSSCGNMHMEFTCRHVRPGRTHTDPDSARMSVRAHAVAHVRPGRIRRGQTTCACSRRNYSTGGWGCLYVRPGRTSAPRLALPGYPSGTDTSAERLSCFVEIATKTKSDLGLECASSPSFHVRPGRTHTGLVSARQPRS